MILIFRTNVDGSGTDEEKSQLRLEVKPQVRFFIYLAF